MREGYKKSLKQYGLLNYSKIKEINLTPNSWQISDSSIATANLESTNLDFFFTTLLFVLISSKLKSFKNGAADCFDNKPDMNLFTPPIVIVSLGTIKQYVKTQGWEVGGQKRPF